MYSILEQKLRKIISAEPLLCDYPDIKRLLRERACVGPWTSSTMHCKDQHTTIEQKCQIEELMLWCIYKRQAINKRKLMVEE